MEQIKKKINFINIKKKYANSDIKKKEVDNLIQNLYNNKDFKNFILYKIAVKYFYKNPKYNNFYNLNNYNEIINFVIENCDKGFFDILTNFINNNIDLKYFDYLFDLIYYENNSLEKKIIQLKEKKYEFNYFCFRYLNYIKNLELPNLSIISNNTSILFTNNGNIKNIEFIIRNMIYKLGDKWSYLVVTNNNNYDFFKNICKSISNNIEIIINNNIDIKGFLSDNNFWNNISSENILIYNLNTIILDNFEIENIDYEFLQSNDEIFLIKKKIINEFINLVENNKNIINTSEPIRDIIYNNFNTKVNNELSYLFEEKICNVLNKYSDWKSILYSKIIKQYRINISRISEFHRGGWNEIMKVLLFNDIYIDNDNNNNNNSLYLELVLENKYQWGVEKKIIDYPWAGFIHTTPNMPPFLEICDLNLMLKNIFFLKSLKTCNIIYVLSESLKKYIDKYIIENNIDTTAKIVNLYHPININSIIPKYHYDNYKNNNDKYIIQIGQQARKYSSIYFLNNIENHKKLWLPGTLNMDKLKNLFNKELKHYKLPQIDFNLVEKKYVKNFEEYDKLLENNIIFIDLIDAAANNVILECILRNSPIIVNRLPATEEYLGKDYPLFFYNLNEVKDLITDEKIKDAINYLKNINLNKFSIEKFGFNLIKNFYI